MGRQKVEVDSGQILIIKKELVKDFVIDKFEMSKEEFYRKKIKENTELSACYSDCCALCWDAKNLASARIHTWPPDA